MDRAGSAPFPPYSARRGSRHETIWPAPPGATLRITDYEWPLLDWARGLIATHVVRLLAGPVFRATPLWTWYLRLDGARVGRGAFVNSLSLMDHPLLGLGEGVVVGSDAHVSGHTVEGGVVKTAPVRPPTAPHAPAGGTVAAAA